MERVFFHAPGTVGRGRDGQLFVTVREITLVVLKIRNLFSHRSPDRRKRAIDADDGIGARCDWTGGGFQIGGRFGRIDAGAAVIEENADVWITESGFDDGGVEGAAADGVDVVARVAVVGREMELAGFVVNHPAGHWDRVLKNFVGNPELFESVNPTSGERE